MENRKLREFGKTNEDTKNDGSTSRTLKAKKDESNAPPDKIGNGTEDLSKCNAKLPTPQVAGAAQGKKKHQKIDGKGKRNRKTAGGPEADADVGQAKPQAQAQEQEQPKRCDKCGKKFGLTGGFSCRCGGTFCTFHRYSDRHDCSFDYREMGASQIRRDNPLVVPEKLRKL